MVTDKDRKLMRTEAIKRLEYLVSWGLDSKMLKDFKSLGRIYINEIGISDWADRNGKTNCSFPRTYVLLDTISFITPEMLQTKMKLENDGYLVYLIARRKRNSPVKENETDKIEYFYIDKTQNRMFYEEDNDYFRRGIARAYVQIRTKDVNEDYFDEVKYKVDMLQVVTE